MYNVNVHLPDGTIKKAKWEWFPPFDKFVWDFNINKNLSFCIVEISEDKKDVWIEFKNGEKNG